MSDNTYRLSGKLAGSGKIGLGLGIVGALGSVLAYFQDSKQFYFSYLTAYCFFLSIALGALFFVMIQHLSRAGWSVTIRRIAENLAANLPLLGLLLIPLLPGIGDLFHWSHATVVAVDPLLQEKSPYLNSPFFFLRSALFVLIWIGLSRYFLKSSLRQDVTGDASISERMSRLAAPGLLLYALTETFFAIDWMMSLDAHWYSAMYGVYYFAGSAVAIMASLIVIAYILRKAGLLRDVINIEHYHDMGKLLYGFNIFWAYIGFSQFMLIWYANIPEETVFFLHRSEGGWKEFSLLLPWGHFAIPFIFLMARGVKRRLPLLFAGAVWLLVMHYVDIYWLIMPNLHHHLHFHFADVTAFLFVGGLFLFFLVNRMKKQPLIPIKDPRLQECLNYDNG